MDNSYQSIQSTNIFDDSSSSSMSSASELDVIGCSSSSFYDLMIYERLRMITFILYGHTWPKMNIISPSLLAKAGFFYLRDDAVQCAFCRGVLRNWNKDDSPMQEHERHFPDCPFIMGKFVGNVPLELDHELKSDDNLNQYSEMNLENQELINDHYNKSKEPSFPIYKDSSCRLASFDNINWPKKLDKKRFVEAGFFYSGKEDRTICHHCGGLLFSWKKEDDPTSDHAKFFPECMFIIEMKGDEYHEFVRFKKQMILMRSKLNKNNATLMIKEINSIRKISFENFKSMKRSLSKLLDILKRPDNNRATEYYEDYFKKFNFLIDCQNISHFFSNEHDSNSSSSALTSLSISSASSSSGDNDDDILSRFSALNLPDSNDSDYYSSKSDCDDEEDEWPDSSKENHSDDDNRMQSTKIDLTCSICYERQIQVVFIPCGHQLACLKCAMQIDVCPVCRNRITSKLRTYFAYPRS
ncbi:baculoviral IAP repeat-containing protein 3-like protein [Sarcoptes scabiei]|uniref:Baculoviral IAP repeat-containing protein 3-like protein n=1 Tax=Sarcoptes scabiei TaxID=52283 RepID=A0A132A649_SARSC|nr:baculoviral IAP repeat-containing protein 3-like protein [Sarcoptes scabiei]